MDKELSDGALYLASLLTGGVDHNFIDVNVVFFGNSEYCISSLDEEQPQIRTRCMRRFC
jgi:hypothetical protein